MIYGSINHKGLPNPNAFHFPSKFFEWKDAVFVEKVLPFLLVGWGGGSYGENFQNFYLDQSANWSIFVFGNIYNFKELAQNIKNSSPEQIPKLLLSLFYKYGPDFAEKLNGDFVIIISNKTGKTTYVFRDHLGIMPFSYTTFDGVLYFSSDTIGLCRAFYYKEPINPEFLLADFKFTDNTLTANRKVKRLLPGHYLKIKENVIEQNKYWFPENIGTKYSYTIESVFNEAIALIEDAIKIRADENLITASHISGGLDSSTVTALVRKHYSKQKSFLGFSWSPDYSLYPSQSEKDERVFVEKICNQLNIEPVFSLYSLNDYKNYFDNPLNFSSFPGEQMIQQFAKEKGVQVIHNGYGGDEFVSCGTYGVFIDLLRSFKWKKYWQVAKTWTPITILKSIILDFLSPTLGILPLSFHIQNQESTRFIKKPFKRNHKPSLRHFFLHKSRKEMHLGMLYNYHIPLRTEEWYNWGSKYGVQYRYPLLDKRIVEFMLKIPSDYLYQDSFGRVLLREAAKGSLPEEVRWSTSKIDPVLFKYSDNLLNKYFSQNFNQLKDFKKNPALAFFDFKKYDKAFTKAKLRDDLKLQSSIVTNFIRLKKIHELTRQYAE